jgi:hypothetical protein
MEFEASLLSTQRAPPLVAIQIHMAPVHTNPSYFSKDHF